MVPKFKVQNGLSELINIYEVLDNVSDVVYLMDMDYKIIWANKALGDLLGKDCGSLIGNSCFNAIHDDDQKCSKCPIDKILETGEAQEGEMSLKCGEIFHIKGIPVKDKNNKVVGIINLSKDITVQKKADEAIEREQLLMNILMDNITDRIYFKDLESKFIRVNKAMATRHGIEDPASVIGLTDFDLFTDEHARPAFDDEQRIIKTGIPILNIEERETWNDGSISWASTIKMPLKDAEGKIFGTFGISRDITERKKSESQITEYVGELKELNATKDKFFSIIAHDLKNPFNNIIGFSELLVEEVYENDLEAIGKYASMIYTASHQTFRLLENLLDWANSHRGYMVFTPEYLSISEIALEIIESQHEFAVKKNISLINAVSEEVIILADRNMLISILRNLVSNAIKFTPRKGEIVLSAIRKDGYLEVSVKDNGMGMSEKVRNDLFRIDVNQSTKGTEDEKGTGLGLVLCKEFVQKHGGKIWVESEIEKGSTFKFTIPL
jgi:PAS domain S-box-containing protein